MFINETFLDLAVGLPPDIERRKQYGDLAGAIRLIDRRLNEDVPEPLKRCMIAQREMMLRLPHDYPYDREAALGILREAVPDFSDAEFDEYMDAGKIDWIYLNGRVHCFRRFFQTLIKTDAAFAARAGAARGRVDGEDTGDSAEKRLLEIVIADMKRTGQAACRFRIRAEACISDEAFVRGETATVHLPIPAEARQISDIVIHKTSEPPVLVSPPDAPQRTICFMRRLFENKPFFVEYSYTNTVTYVNAYEGKGEAGTVDSDLDEQPPHIVFTPYLRALVHELTEGASDPLDKARRIYDFITTKVKYSYMRAYFGLENIAETCARSLRGDCGVQALLFITLCRISGIPARWQSALYTPPDGPGSHDWAEFYVEPYGWLFADPSFGGGAHRVGNEERRRFYFGNLDPYRLVANRAFQAPLMPQKQHWRADPYDNQTGEIEYLSRGLRNGEFSTDQTIVSFERL